MYITWTRTALHTVYIKYYIASWYCVTPVVAFGWMRHINSYKNSNDVIQCETNVQSASNSFSERLDVRMKSSLDFYRYNRNILRWTFRFKKKKVIQTVYDRIYIKCNEWWLEIQIQKYREKFMSEIEKLKKKNLS